MRYVAQGSVGKLSQPAFGIAETRKAINTISVKVGCGGTVNSTGRSQETKTAAGASRREKKMSSRFREDAYVACPYYRKEADHEIRCDGNMPRVIYTTQEWDVAADKEAFKKEYCCTNYERCVYFKSISKRKIAETTQSPG